MKGLIKKDFLLIKSNLKSFIVIILVFTLFSMNGEGFDVSFILPFLAIMMFISTFSWDEFNNFNAYAITLPIGRKNIVKSKYISAIIFIAIATIIGLIISYLTTILSKNIFDIEAILSNLFGTLLGLSIILAIWLPVVYKFGVEKGRIMLFVGVFALVFLCATLSKLFDFTSLINFLNSLDKVLFIAIPLISIAIMVISYLISVRIYLKKEF